MRWVFWKKHTSQDSFIETLYLKHQKCGSRNLICHRPHWLVHAKERIMLWPHLTIFAHSKGNWRRTFDQLFELLSSYLMVVVGLVFQQQESVSIWIKCKSRLFVAIWARDSSSAKILFDPHVLPNSMGLSMQCMQGLFFYHSHRTIINQHGYSEEKIKCPPELQSLVCSLYMGQVVPTVTILTKDHP